MIRRYAIDDEEVNQICFNLGIPPEETLNFYRAVGILERHANRPVPQEEIKYISPKVFDVLNRHEILYLSNNQYIPDIGRLSAYKDPLSEFMQI